MSLLLIPPFPGARLTAFKPLSGSGEPSPALIAEAAALLRQHRVGGSYWGAQPELASRSTIEALAMDKNAAPCGSVVWSGSNSPVPAVSDPWHVLAHAERLICSPDDPLAVVAELLEVEVMSPSGTAPSGSFESRLVRHLPHAAFESPFDGSALSLLDAITLCGHWRRLIDANRALVAGIGFGLWKQPTVAPLLWGGGAPLRFVATPSAAPSSGTLAVWQARTSASSLREIKEKNCPTVEVEDGFLRSQGLGADCIPPLSITVDSKGPYFDPRQPSELDDLLCSAEFDKPLLDRAAQLIHVLREGGVGKYESGTLAYPRQGGPRRHILVPGQVEDDRSVQSGGFGLGNLDLLKAVRAARPDGFVIYKPHPDVEAGHRQGAIATKVALAYADVVETSAGMASLLSASDEVHVITSQAGFEALIHGKDVWTHGVPFYAGWGLTHDLGPVPQRRGRQRSIEELVAAALILYPRYLDPVSGLPCPAEIVVQRLTGARVKAGLLVRARRLQGRVRRQLRNLAG